MKVVDWENLEGGRCSLAEELASVEDTSAERRHPICRSETLLASFKSPNTQTHSTDSVGEEHSNA